MENRTIQNAYNFVCWFRRMVIEGQITATDYATAQRPCSDYELQQALELLARSTDAEPTEGIARQSFRALRGMLDAYAPHADETAKQSGEASLHSAVRKAREVMRKVQG